VQSRIYSSTAATAAPGRFTCGREESREYSSTIASGIFDAICATTQLIKIMFALEQITNLNARLTVELAPPAVDQIYVVLTALVVLTVLGVRISFSVARI
jgi:hypothetical protein